MIEKIRKSFREYMEYRRKRKIVKRAILSIAATILLKIGKLNSKLALINGFITKVIEASKDVTGEEFYKIIVSETADALKCSENRVAKTFMYIMSLTPEEIQKIITYGVIKNNTELNDEKENI